MLFSIAGTIAELPDEAATLIAEDARRLKIDERWRELADPIEARLVGAEDGPLELAAGDAYLLIKPLTVLAHGPYSDEARRLLSIVLTAK